METVEDEANFHPVVKLLIARMGSNPEEFDGNGLWRSRVDIYDDAYTKEETEALAAAERSIRLGRKHEAVMQSLLSTPQEDEERERLARASLLNTQLGQNWQQANNGLQQYNGLTQSQLFNQMVQQAYTNTAVTPTGPIPTTTAKRRKTFFK